MCVFSGLEEFRHRSNTFIFDCGDEVALLKEQKCCCCWMVALRVAAGTLAVPQSLAGLELTGLIDEGEEHLPQLCCI